MNINSKVIIMDGLHCHGYGELRSITRSTEIPFASVQLRGARGQLLATRFALVPLKYCQILDDAGRALLKRVKAAKVAARKAKRSADIAADITFNTARCAALQQTERRA